MIIIISILVFFGAFFILISAIGLLRFSDLFSRMHAITKASSIGIAVLLSAVALFFGSISILIKSILIIFFIFITAPLAAHAIAKSYERGENQFAKNKHEKKQ